MGDIITLKSACCSAATLKSYLQRKGENHNYYKCYSRLEYVVDIRDSNCLYLNNGEKWNDISDRENFNASTNPFVNFGKCFSFSQDENVAMWMLYGGIDKKSGMIDFTKKAMRSLINIPTVQIGCWENNKFVSLLELTKDQFEIYITDVIYYNKKGSVYYINRSDEHYSCLSEKVFSKLLDCKKTYSWKYENECRLIVRVNRDLLNEKCKVVKIDLHNVNTGKSFERIYHGPNYPLGDTHGTLPSKLRGTIDWSLCDKEICPMNNENNGDKS